MNELRIHTIADLQPHVCHHGVPKGPIHGFDRIHDMALQDLPGNPPSSFKEPQESGKNPHPSRYGERYRRTKMKFSTVNDKILSHRRPNSFHDEWSREADERFSAWGDFFIVQRCFGVNESKGKNQPNKTKRGTYIDGRFPWIYRSMVLLTPFRPVW